MIKGYWRMASWRYAWLWLSTTLRVNLFTLRSQSEIESQNALSKENVFEGLVCLEAAYKIPSSTLLTLTTTG